MVDAATVAAYRAALNVAANYRWSAGLRPPDAGFSGGAGNFAFCISKRPTTDMPWGLDLPADFWVVSAPPVIETGAFIFATIPVNAEPERVLQRLLLLR
jgi:hypothetical protein